MTLLNAVVLGIVQGLTEFLPISSDGHLAVTYRLMGQKPNLTFEIFLHAATLLAMVIYFRRDIVELASSLLPANKDRREDRRLVALIVLGTIVSGVVALLVGPVVEPMSESMVWVGVWFLGTAALLVLGEILGRRVTHLEHTSDLGWLRTTFIGLLQGAAVLPGLSRSGSTIAAGLMAGLSREKAARFSFLLGIPIITLAAAKDGLDLLGGAATLPPLAVSAAGFIAAGLSGYLAVAGLLKFVKRHALWVFAAYTAVLGTVILVLVTVR